VANGTGGQVRRMFFTERRSLGQKFDYPTHMFAFAADSVACHWLGIAGKILLLLAGLAALLDLTKEQLTDWARVAKHQCRLAHEDCERLKVSSRKSCGGGWARHAGAWCWMSWL